MARQNKADNVLIAGLTTRLSDVLFKKGKITLGISQPRLVPRSSQIFIVKQHYNTAIEEIVNWNKTNLKKKTRLTLVEGFPENLKECLNIVHEKAWTKTNSQSKRKHQAEHRAKLKPKSEQKWLTN